MTNQAWDSAPCHLVLIAPCTVSEEASNARAGHRALRSRPRTRGETPAPR